MAPNVSVENSIENLQKLLQSLHGAIEQAERDFHAIEQKPDMDDALIELSMKVEKLKAAVVHKFEEELPGAAGDIATELSQLELAAEGAVREMDALEESLESADLDLLAAVSQTETQLQESYAGFTQSHHKLSEHLSTSVAAAAESHEHTDAECKRYLQFIDDTNTESLEHFDHAKDALEQATQLVDETIATSADNTMQSISTTLENSFKAELETTMDTFEERSTVDVAWLIKVEDHMGGVAGGCIAPINELGRHCTETVAPELDKGFEKVLTEAVPELVNEYLQDLSLVTVAHVAGEGIRPLLPELAVADRTLEAFNAELEKISADAP